MLQVAEKRRKPSPTLMFTEVYAEMPARLRKQHEQMRAHVMKQEEYYPNTFAPICDLPTLSLPASLDKRDSLIDVSTSARK